MAMQSVLLVVLLMVVGSYQHGRLMDPVNRGSMWRVGYSVTPDYNDEQQNCGGRPNQWEVQGGKCGECGDDYGMARPRTHENTGTYGKGIIVRNYTAGSTISSQVFLSTNHMGRFYFSICPLANQGALETEDCFAKYPLKLADGSDSYALLDNVSGKTYTVNVVLPAGVTCKQCVFRWNWVVGNNWGTCANGTQALGCGPQETFRGCADVSIH